MWILGLYMQGSVTYGPFIIRYEVLIYIQRTSVLLCPTLLQQKATNCSFWTCPLPWVSH